METSNFICQQAPISLSHFHPLLRKLLERLVLYTVHEKDLLHLQLEQLCTKAGNIRCLILLSHANQMVMNVAHSILNLGIGLLKVVVDGQLMYVTVGEDIEEDRDEVIAVTVLPTDVGRNEVIKAIDCLNSVSSEFLLLISGHFH